MGLVFGACSDEEPALAKTSSSFTLQGEWQGINWYCNNSKNCVVNPVDKTAILSFDITTDKGIIAVTPCKYILPSCVTPNCTINDWIVTAINYSNDVLTITWSYGYIFKGTRQDNKFVGFLTYKYSQGEYVWNDNVELIKNE
jgi:hypothetical protein